MNPQLEGQVVLVAGGTGGLGRAVTSAFLSEKSRVIVTYREQKEFDELLQIAEKSEHDLKGFRVDVTDETAVAGLIESIVREYGRLDVAVNTVGVYAGGLKLWETSLKTLDQMISLNLRSGFVIAKAIVPRMIAQKRGSIINIAAKAAFDHAAGASAYAASKASAVAMMDSLAEDLRGTGVRVNSVLPNIIDTEANRRAMPNADFSKWPKPQDIARVIMFLCADDAKLIHGASIPVYGNS
jgi:NAD(P)-dependent dehydrogenase (short-subunit alcohol dehydrogenase family)